MSDATSNGPEPYITAQEAADYLGIALQTVYNKTSQGSLPHYRRGGILRFRRSELDAWIAEKDAEAKSEPSPST